MSPSSLAACVVAVAAALTVMHRRSKSSQTCQPVSLLPPILPVTRLSSPSFASDSLRLSNNGRQARSARPAIRGNQAAIHRHALTHSHSLRFAFSSCFLMLTLCVEAEALSSRLHPLSLLLLSSFLSTRKTLSVEERMSGCAFTYLRHSCNISKGSATPASEGRASHYSCSGEIGKTVQEGRTFPKPIAYPTQDMMKSILLVHCSRSSFAAVGILTSVAAR